MASELLRPDPLLPRQPRGTGRGESRLPHGGYPIRIEETEFSYADYALELSKNAQSIEAFKHRQQAAFETERQRWKAEGLDSFVTDDGGRESFDGDVPEGCFGVASSVPGNIWKLLVEPGSHVSAGDTVAIIESMKMEINVTSHVAGRVRELRAAPGRTVKAGDLLIVLEEP